MPVPWMHLVIVGVGGFFGSAARYLVTAVVNGQFSSGYSPMGTAVVNITGCLALGLLAGLTDARGLLSPEMRLLVLTGMIGGFTTFSTFEYETFAMLREGAIVRALLNATVQMLLGLACVAGGYAAAHAMGRTP